MQCTRNKHTCRGYLTGVSRFPPTYSLIDELAASIWIALADDTSNFVALRDHHTRCAMHSTAHRTCIHISRVKKDFHMIARFNYILCRFKYPTRQPFALNHITFILYNKYVCELNRDL